MHAFLWKIQEKSCLCVCVQLGSCAYLDSLMKNSCWLIQAFSLFCTINGYDVRKSPSSKNFIALQHCANLLVTEWIMMPCLCLSWSRWCLRAAGGRGWNRLGCDLLHCAPGSEESLPQLLLPLRGLRPQVLQDPGLQVCSERVLHFIMFSEFLQKDFCYSEI